MFFKEYLLFKDGRDEDAERETALALVQSASSPSWQHRFLPAFVELLKRE